MRTEGPGAIPGLLLFPRCKIVPIWLISAAPVVNKFRVVDSDAEDHQISPIIAWVRYLIQGDPRASRPIQQSLEMKAGKLIVRHLADMRCK